MLPQVLRMALIIIICGTVTANAVPVVADDAGASETETAIAETPAEAPPIVEAARVPNLSGAWRGSWLSHANGHKGPMQGTFTQLDACRYQVHFKGRFWKLIPFNYTVVLTVTGQDADRVSLSGSHKLGPVLGTFSYSAWASSTQFVAGYCSEKDRGQFVMSRCGR